ncbi:MAG: multicopper oxidase domain-containing protein [Candidatus Thiodiazotropha sp. DIVDIV]
MKTFSKNTLAGAIALTLLGFMGSAGAVVNIQCPGDTNGDAIIDDPNAPTNHKCMSLVAGDGFAVMSDDNPMYIFGFGNQTGTAETNVIANGILDAEWSGPTIELDEGDEFWLNLTNVGTVIRPDLFDPHTIHWHGFPNASAVFDGVPEVSISINMGATLSYYYNVVEPGTYLYHCHVEATEHMEMGMLANLYVHPRQDETGCVTPNVNCPVATRKGGTAPNAPLGYVYNDDDGTTAFDHEVALQLSSFDAEFHDASLFVQPLPFALLEGEYPQFNGRGYPDTVRAGDLPPPVDDANGKVTGTPGEILNNGTPSQTLDSVIEVNHGERLLLRLSNVGLDRFWTISAPGLKMTVVGTGARHMRGVDGKNLYHTTSSLNFGGGETVDVILETADIAPGTYFLHATELHQMSNMTQFDGGMITEIVVN